MRIGVLKGRELWIFGGRTVVVIDTKTGKELTRKLEEFTK